MCKKGLVEESPSQEEAACQSVVLEEPTDRPGFPPYSDPDNALGPQDSLCPSAAQIPSLKKQEAPRSPRSRIHAQGSAEKNRVVGMETGRVQRPKDQSATAGSNMDSSRDQEPRVEGA